MSVFNKSAKSSKSKENEEENRRQKTTEEFKYNKSTRGWMGPIQAKMVASKVGFSDGDFVTTQIAKLRANKKKQEELNEKTKSKPITKKDVGVVEVDLENDEDDACSVDGEGVLDELPVIRRPFSSVARDITGNYASWKAPDKLKKQRVKEFDWSKPASNTQSSSFSSPAQQVIRLQEDMVQKDKDIAILRHQLMKAQKDNHDLVQELEGYKGEHYEDMKIQNVLLKEQVDRVSRENVHLRGLIRQEHNSILHKLEHERDVDEKNNVTKKKGGSILRKPESINGSSKSLNQSKNVTTSQRGFEEQMQHTRTPTRKEDADSDKDR